jgi:hypothetical protein
MYKPFKNLMRVGVEGVPIPRLLQHFLTNHEPFAYASVQVFFSVVGAVLLWWILSSFRISELLPQDFLLASGDPPLGFRSYTILLLAFNTDTCYLI